MVTIMAPSSEEHKLTHSLGQHISLVYVYIISQLCSQLSDLIMIFLTLWMNYFLHIIYYIIALIHKMHKVYRTIVMYRCR